MGWALAILSLNAQFFFPIHFFMINFQVLHFDFDDFHNIFMEDF
jgi:hypothetical protein